MTVKEIKYVLNNYTDNIEVYVNGEGALFTIDKELSGSFLDERTDKECPVFHIKLLHSW